MAGLAIALALVALRSAPSAQPVQDRYRGALQPALERLIHEQELPGFAIAVVEDNRVAYAAGFGVLNVKGNKHAITTRSLFHMASITKTFVATSIMQLVESRKVDLDAPVVKYLPYFHMADERYRTITVRQMVTHTSGMPDVDDYNRIHTPSSNLHSNVLDMARWAIANMNRGELEGVRVLNAPTYDVMWKPAAEFGGKPSPTGISWFLGEYRGNRLVAHDGGDTGFRTSLAMLPDRKIAVVWMTNAEWLPNAAAVTHAALDVALGREPGPIGGKRSIGEAALELDPGQAHAAEGLKRLKK
jgi:CubicO group peptidase (beta-lactamase class C family)